MLSRLRSLARALFRREEFESTLSEELAFHLDARAADLERQGLAPEAARRRARLELGARETYREQCREARGLRLFDEFSADLRYAFRAIRHAPGFALVAIATLALAMATNLAFFTFLDAFLLRPLPVRSAARYVDLEAVNERHERTPRFRAEDLAALDTALKPAFEALYGNLGTSLPLLDPVRRTVQVQAVSPSFLSLFAAVPARGRWLLPALPEARLTGGETDAVVLSDSGWARLFARDPGVLGRKLRLGRQWLTVVGVMGPDFEGVDAVLPDLWLSLAALRQLSNGEPPPRFDLAGVLRSGTPLETAARLASSALIDLGPRGDGDEPVAVQVLPRRSRLQFEERREVGRLGLILSAVFVLVLLVACANLASLQLARAGARHREIATRLSLGASRFRLVRQLLTESFVLALLSAGLAAVAVAFGSSALQSRIFALAADAGITLVPVSAHWRVLAFALLLAVAAAFATGLLPALQATATDLAGASRRDGLALGSRLRQQKLTRLLIGGQVAGSLILLTVAALLIRNTEIASRFEAGFAPERLVDVRFGTPTPAVAAKLAARPDVAAVAGVGFTPLSGVTPRTRFQAAGAEQVLGFNFVDHRFFETLEIPLEAGRGFWPEEAAHGTPVAVVSAATARKLWPGQSPLGQTLAATAEEGAGLAGRDRVYQVVGVAADVTSGFTFQGRDASLVYLPAAVGSPSIANLVVRPRGEGSAFARALPAFCAEVDPDVLCEPKTLAELAGLQRFPFLAGSLVAAALGALALLLTALGLHGLVAFAVVRRQREMGVRIALGATSGQVLRSVASGALASVLTGAAVGLPLCWLLSLFVRRLFTLLAPFDPAVLLGAPVLLAAVALLAALLPARRALRADPVLSLRAE